MILNLTGAAVCDLQSIRNYTLERWGSEQEQAYLDSAQGKHVILFRIQGNTLEIVRTLHSAMDFRRHIPGDLNR